MTENESIFFGICYLVSKSFKIERLKKKLIIIQEWLNDVLTQRLKAHEKCIFNSDPLDVKT